MNSPNQSKTSRMLRASFAPVVMSVTLTLMSLPFAEPSKISSAFAQSAPGTPSNLNNPDPGVTQTIRVDGSNSMKVTNELRAQQLQQQSPNVNVQSAYNGTDQALQSVLNGEIDLAAIGRPLTAEEEAEGLVAVPQERVKIAIITGSDNPFNGSLNYEQFAQIFRGEITDWSEVGGPPGAIKLVDRPDENDTRQALENYSIFQQAPFVAAEGSVKLTDDSTEAVVEELGTNGISYVAVDSIVETSRVRIVPMHQTLQVLPSDPRYPFSQPLAYVYQGPTPNPAAAQFLGIATDTTATAPLQAEVPASVNASTPAPDVPVVVATAAPDAVVLAPVRANENADFPWWLLSIPLIGGLLWWLLTRSRPAPSAATVIPPSIFPIPPDNPAAPVPPDHLAPNVVDNKHSSTHRHRESLGGDEYRQDEGKDRRQ